MTASPRALFALTTLAALVGALLLATPAHAQGTSKEDLRAMRAQRAAACAGNEDCAAMANAKRAKAAQTARDREAARLQADLAELAAGRAPVERSKKRKGAAAASSAS